MTYLYCPTPGCGEYLGSLGGDSCRFCGWVAGSVPEPEPEDEDHEMTDCPMCAGEAAPLGQLGRVIWYRCRACGWQFSLATEGACDD